MFSKGCMPEAEINWKVISHPNNVLCLLPSENEGNLSLKVHQMHVSARDKAVQ